MTHALRDGSTYRDSEAYPAGRCHECGNPDPPDMDEWVKLLGLTTDLLTATDAVMEVFTGELNKTIKTREEAVPEIARRTEAYQAARNAVISYARAIQEDLE